MTNKNDYYIIISQTRMILIKEVPMTKTKRYSAKREAILQLIKETKTHPTAEWVFQQLKPKFPDLSLGTVYRNLSEFRQDGTLISVGVVNGQERFDAETGPHTHFICTCCGGVSDVHQLVVPEELADRLTDNAGVRVDHYQLTFRGICKECLAKESC